MLGVTLCLNKKSKPSLYSTQVNMRQLFSIILFASFFHHTSAVNDDIIGTVISVIDGNTVEVQSTSKDKYKVVLAGIDCPELAQQYGTEAKKYLEKLALKKTVTLQLKGKDRNGNHIAILLLNGDDDLRVELLKQGLAWTSEKGSNADLDPYRSWAQQKKKGLWQEENPTPPWTYRRQQSMREAKSSN